MIEKVLNFIKGNEKGQAIAEYGLILALVSVIAIGAISGVGGTISDTFDKVVGVIDTSEGLGDEDIDDMINDGYIPVATAAELDNLRKYEIQTFGEGTEWEGEYLSGLDKKYIQVLDINLSGVGNFEPIGTFTGVFDGGKFVISNLKVSKPMVHGVASASGVGLFSNAHGTTFGNIKLENVDVEGHKNVGGLVGYHSNESNVASIHITNSYVTGKVVGYENIGGLVGYQHNYSKITNCYSEAEVIGDDVCSECVGGLVGQLELSSIERSYSTGNVYGKDAVGGLFGGQSESSVENSYATGDVSGEELVGGIAGTQANSSSIKNVYATGKITKRASFTGEDTYVGGLLGANIINSHISDSGWANDINPDLEGVGFESVGIMFEKSTSSNIKGLPKSEIDEIIKDLIK